MSRRNVLLGLGTLIAGGGAVLGTGAFTSVQAERTVNVQTAGDASAFLTLAPSSGPNGAYATQTDGTLQINLDGTGTNADGLNQNAITRIKNIVTATNNGNQDVSSLTFTFTVTGTSDDAAHEQALSITSGSDTYPGTGANNILDSALGTGESVNFGIEVDLVNGGVNGNFESSANVTLTITAEA